MAKFKDVHEAIVLIPYLPKRIIIPLVNAEYTGVTYTPNSLNFDEQNYYATREIIPGKHFLPINEVLFTTLLNFHLIENTDNKFSPIYHGAAEQNNEIQKEYWQGVRDHALRNTDVGRLIETISSFAPNGGYQLPPEFDFFHNASVPPFQMIIQPFSHKLYKQELIDIYQGIMPDSSIFAEKTERTGIVHPTHEPGGDVKQYIPEINDDIMLHRDITNFLSPRMFTHPEWSAYSQNNLSLRPYKTASEFYRNLRFMVFKVKQRGKKNYSSYRKSQIANAILSTLQGKENKDYQEFSPLEESSKPYLKTIKNKSIGQVYGSNWPYDYFSFIQTLKIDIDFEVE